MEAGERLIVKLPSQEKGVIGIEPYRGTSDTLNSAKRTELLSHSYWGELVMGNGWPSDNTTGTDLKDHYDLVTKTVDITGPVDFPRYPNPSYPDLMETGAPTFLFDVSKASYYDIVVGPEIVPGFEADVTVTARNASGEVVTDWNSTMLYVVTWIVDDGGSVLSVEHTFDLSEAGVFRTTFTLQVGKWLFEARDLLYEPDVYGSLAFEIVELG